MAEQKVKKQISFDEDKLIINENGSFELLGTKCNDCGTTAPGKHPACWTCSSRNIKVVNLAKIGTLNNYSQVMIKPSVEWKGPVPYIMSEVMMPEGCSINTMLFGIDYKDVKKGMKVKAAIEKADTNEEGDDIMIYVWRPA